MKPKEYVSGESFAYLGKNYRLLLTQDNLGAVKLKNGRLVLGVDQKLTIQEQESLVKDKLVKWYIYHAEQWLIDKTNRYAKMIGVHPQSVKVKSYKSRWGSCSAKDEVSYNWKIIIAPHHIVDYVVIHELCHILHHNHSSEFWKSVARIIPDYKECRKWLKANGSRLSLN